MIAMHYISLPYVALTMAMVLAGGLLVACRGHGICSRDTLREMLLWVGGFIVYAVVDYFILMR